MWLRRMFNNLWPSRIPEKPREYLKAYRGLKTMAKAYGVEDDPIIMEQFAAFERELVKIRHERAT